MTEYTAYAFDVQIWEDADEYNWAVTQEFTAGTSGSEIVVLGFGTEDSYADAATAAGAIIRSHFDDV